MELVTIQAANAGYARANIPTPGFTGGPCLGKDGVLLDTTPFSTITTMAWKLNEAIPRYIVMTLVARLGSLSRRKTGVLGLAFKADSDDTHLSPSVKLVEELKAYGADVKVHDPHIPTTQSLEDVLSGAEIIVVATKHRPFQQIAPLIDNSGCKIIYDVWAIYDQNDFSKVQYMRFGRAWIENVER